MFSSKIIVYFGFKLSCDHELDVWFDAVLNLYVTMGQGDQFNMAVILWYLVLSDLFSVRHSTRVQ